MISLDVSQARRLLCIGAHCDDIEIGAGGTILRALRANPDLEVRWVVFSADDRRAAEGMAAADRFLAGAAKKQVEIHRFRESYFPYHGTEIKECMSDLGRSFEPDVVLTHTADDLHQDHRLLAELTWNTFRDHLILGYEIPKWDGDLGRPNVYSPIEGELVEEKIEILMSCFASQRGRDWFTEDLFHSLLRLRGMECRSPSRLAEAFHGRKLLLGTIG